jgi:hypothetical protein
MEEGKGIEMVRALAPAPYFDQRAIELGKTTSVQLLSSYPRF